VPDRIWQSDPDLDHRPTLRRRLILALLAFPALVAFGTVGYMVVEGWSLSDALFMAATTITTVGFGEVRPLTERGRFFTIVLLVVGLAAVWYALSVLVRVALEGELGLRWEERRMERQTRQVRGHHIIAGFGRVGRQTAQALRDLGHQVVVIDEAPEAVRDALAAGFLAVEGNATEDATLQRAGVERAAGLVAALGSDADNVFVTLSARALNATLPIVARANTGGAVPKLTRAGATQVVSPYDMAGRQMARLAVRPRTVDFIENLFQGQTGGLVVEDVRVDDGSPLVGATIREVQERVPQAVLLAVRRQGQTLAPPDADFRLASGDEIAAVGTEAHLRHLEVVSQVAADMPPLHLPVPAKP
jgi:voltage-gated potassium channel